MLWIWASIPMGSRVVSGDGDGVNTADQRFVQAVRLVQAAQDFRDAAARPGASLAAPATVAPLEEGLQEINAGWYWLADAAAPRIATRRRLLEIQADARAGSLSRSMRSTSPRPCTTSPLPSRPVHARRQARPIAEPLIAGYASPRRSGRDSEPPSATSRALDPGVSPRDRL
jgi:hypothetical protein